MKTYFIIM